jgi:transposase
MPHAASGLDTSKHVFQLHGVNAGEKPVLRKKMRRKEMRRLFHDLPANIDRDRGLWWFASLGALTHLIWT